MAELLYSEIFEYPAIKLNCNPEIYNDPVIAAGIDNIFSGNRVKRNDTSLSTCPIPGALTDIEQVPGIQSLLTFISESILDHSDLLGKTNATTVTFTQGWTNRIFKGCANQCHTHGAPADGVAVFYYDVPDKDAGNLILVKNGQNETPVSMYPEKDCHHVKVKTGDLIIHHRSIPHAVSTHNSDKPRTCLVFNFVLT